MKIEDGGGSGKAAKVNQKQRLDVSAASFSEGHLISAVDGQAYVWTSAYSASTGNEIIYIKNESKTKKLIIEDIEVGGVLTGLFEIFETADTASGTTTTGKNLNLSSGNVADTTAFGNAAVTGITTAVSDRLGMLRVSANSDSHIDYRDTLILGFGDAICVTYTGSTGLVECQVLGYFESEGDL